MICVYIFVKAQCKFLKSKNTYVLTTLLNAPHTLKRKKTMPSSVQTFACRWLMIFNNNFINAADFSISHGYSSAAVPGSSHWHQCGAAQGHQGRRATGRAASIGQKQGVGLSTALESAREMALQISCKGNNPPETTWRFLPGLSTARGADAALCKASAPSDACAEQVARRYRGLRHKSRRSLETTAKAWNDVCMRARCWNID